MKKRPDVYGEYYEWVKGFDICAVSDDRCLGGLTGHHVKTVGAGGKDYGNVVPLCTRHHTAVHTIGRISFERQFGVDLHAIAHGYAEMWEQRAP